MKSVFRRLCVPLSPVVLAVATACAGSADATTEPQPQVQPASSVDPDLARRMERLAARIDQHRVAMDIPGLALVVVQGDQVLLSKGMGMRNVAGAQPVDEDTLFAIGSTTKAFTAALVLMAVEEGKISLDDHPRKCVPYFKLRDENADAKITVRDLLTHTSGLQRTDLAMMTGALNTEELIRVAGQAEPTAELGERFQYQNVMYTAAGVCAANLYGTSYAELLESRIFEPLGMTHGTNVSVAETLKHPARAVGYTRAGLDDVVMPIPMRNIDASAPAGAINASIRDIAPWLQLLLGKGARGDVRLLQERSFKEMTKNQQSVGGGMSYGLGWMRDRWRTHKRLWHSGGIDGFVTLISVLPKENVAFALFTNIQNADIHGTVTEEVYAAVLDPKWEDEPDPGAALPAGAEKEVGTYGVVGGLTADVAVKNGKLVLTVPKQPPYELVPMEARKYRLGQPAPSGFYATFRPGTNDAARPELFLQQPHGDMVLPLLRDQDYEAIRKAGVSPELAELLGVYGVKGKDAELEVGLSEGRVALLVPGQLPAPIVAMEGAKDSFGLEGMPEGFHIDAQRKGKTITKLTLVQPSGSLELELRRRSAPPRITAPKLISRMRRAMGSRALARQGAVSIQSNLAFVNQGIEARRSEVRVAGNRYREDVVLRALGRDIGTTTAIVDDGKAVRHSSFLGDLPLRKGESDALQLAGLFDPLQEQPELFGKPRILRSGEIEGEPTVVMEVPLVRGGSLVLHVSSKSNLVLEQHSSLPIGPGGMEIAETVRFADYRRIKGVMIPHERTITGLQGKIVERVESVSVGTEPAPETFADPPAERR